jgi:hypothetical protein
MNITTFLSHNSEDKKTIETIGFKLLAEGITPWIDKWNLIPGKMELAHGRMKK